MTSINLVYIDDNIDANISSYLDNLKDKYEDVSIDYKEMTFIPENGYKSLLNEQLVNSANIIVIDDRLYEDRNATNGKVSGEELKLVLRKYLPYIETIVITQNEAEKTKGTIPKYKSDVYHHQTPEQFYDEFLKPAIDKAIESVNTFRKLLEGFEQNGNWEIIIREKVIDSLEGSEKYESLSKSDIDDLISAFKDFERAYIDEH